MAAENQPPLDEAGERVVARTSRRETMATRSHRFDGLVLEDRSVNIRPVPSVAETLTRLSRERGILKKAIAEKMGMDPTFLSQLIHNTRSLDAQKIENLTATINVLDKSGKRTVKPWEFEPYVREMAAKTLEHDASLARIMRGVLFEMSAEERDIWTEMSLAILNRHAKSDQD